MAITTAALSPSASAQTRELGVVESQAARFHIDVMAESLVVPAGFAFLPDGRLVVAERQAGRFTLVDPRTGSRVVLADQPPIDPRVEGGGGAHEVMLHPGYSGNGWIYVTYSAASGGPDTNLVLALDRFRLDGARIVGRQRLFSSRPAVAPAGHFGGRIVFDAGYLFLTVGDRSPEQIGRDEAQSLRSHAGKVLRLFDDGRVPPDNPFAGNPAALPEIWSLGHRNPQGIIVYPPTGALWLHEHGPLGGDEINGVLPGRNYGWPVITYGREYTGSLVGDGRRTREGMENPVHYWVPSIGPSGMAYYDNAAFPGWRGSLFIGALGTRHLARLVFDAAGRRILEERLLLDRRWRVRDVRVGPDGALWLAVDDGMILRLRP